MAGAGGSRTVRRRDARAARLGRCPAGCSPPDEVREQVADGRARAQTGPSRSISSATACQATVDDSAWRALLQPYYEEFGVDARQRRCDAPAVRRGEMCDVVEETEAARSSASTSACLESALLERVKAAGAVVIGNATTSRKRVWLEQRGVDAIIAQGFEAGGHTGRFLGSDPAEALGLFALLPQVADAVRGTGHCRRRDRRRTRHRRGAARSARAPSSSAPPISTRRKRRSATCHRGQAQRRPNVVHQPDDRRARARPARPPHR